MASIPATIRDSVPDESDESNTEAVEPRGSTDSGNDHSLNRMSGPGMKGKLLSSRKRDKSVKADVNDSTDDDGQTQEPVRRSTRNRRLPRRLGRSDGQIA